MQERIPRAGQRAGVMGVGHPVVGAADRDLAVPVGRGQPVAFGGDGPGREPEHAEDAGGDNERLACAGQGLAEGLDRRAVGGGGAGEVAGEGDVVLEREVDDAVGGGGGLAQGAEVVERPPVDPGPRGPQGLGRGIGTGEPGDLVAGRGQLGDEPAADPARRSGDENAHGNLSRT